MTPLTKAGSRTQCGLYYRVALNNVPAVTKSIAIVSLQVKFDSDAFIKSRNSGLCISTGTGSTSWTYNINKLTSQTLSDILHILKAEGKCKGDPNDHELVRRVTQTFNNELIFDAEANQMSYTIRDPISMTHRAYDYPGMVADTIFSSPCFSVTDVRLFIVSFRLKPSYLSEVHKRRQPLRTPLALFDF